MYRNRVPQKSRLTSVDTWEGETIEQKIERIRHNGEPIEDGAPEIFTTKSKGVIAAYNIRTDRFEVAAEAMDAVTRSQRAQRDVKPDAADMTVVKGGNGGDSADGRQAKSEGGA